jgi:hypothetical protein
LYLAGRVVIRLIQADERDCAHPRSLTVEK